jgi:hypothetical protein
MIGQTGKTSSQPQFHILFLTGCALIAKTARHDAHDVIKVVVQAQSFADDLRISPEFPPPEPVAHHDLEVEAGSGIVRIEGAAQLCVYAEERKVARRNLLEAETKGLCNAGEVHAAPVPAIDTDWNIPVLCMSLHSGMEMPTPCAPMPGRSSP